MRHKWVFGIVLPVVIAALAMAVPVWAQELAL